MARYLRDTGPRTGNAAVEFAVLLPFLLTLLLGIWEGGRLIQVNQVLDNAAREGGRLASTGLHTNADVQLAVCQYLKDAGLPDYTANPGAVVTVSDVTQPGTDVSQADELDQLRVQVSVPFRDVRWIALSLITTSGSTLNAEADWYSAKDQTYPTNITPPLGD